jgi:hypothetical protein
MSLSRLRPTGRWQAVAIHLLVTLSVASCAALLVFGVWYPYPYRFVSGGLELFAILISADVVIGPLLTAVVFNVAKGSRQLRFDIAVIALLQLAFLSYGLHSVFAARPVYMVYEVDRFRVMSAADIDPADLPLAQPAFRSLPIDGPRLIGTRRSTPGPEQLKSVMLAMQGKDLAQRPAFYQPFELSRAEAVSRAKPLETLYAKYPQRHDELDQAIRQAGLPREQLRYLPLVARKQWVAIVRADTADPLAYAPFDGF